MVNGDISYFSPTLLPLPLTQYLLVSLMHSAICKLVAYNQCVWVCVCASVFVFFESHNTQKELTAGLFYFQPSPDEGKRSSVQWHIHVVSPLITTFPVHPGNFVPHLTRYGCMSRLCVFIHIEELSVCVCVCACRTHTYILYICHFENKTVSKLLVRDLVPQNKL